MNEFITWLNTQIDANDWTISSFSRRAGVSQSTASNVLNGKTPPTFEFVRSAAEALGTDPVPLLRMAELLPDEPPHVQAEEELIRNYRRMSQTDRDAFLRQSRGLVGQDLPPAPTHKALPTPEQLYQIFFRVIRQIHPANADEFEERLYRILEEQRREDAQGGNPGNNHNNPELARQETAQPSGERS